MEQVCHAGDRGFESRRSRENICKSEQSAVCSDGRHTPTTQTSCCPASAVAGLSGRGPHNGCASSRPRSSDVDHQRQDRQLLRARRSEARVRTLLSTELGVKSRREGRLLRPFLQRMHGLWRLVAVDVLVESAEERARVGAVGLPDDVALFVLDVDLAPTLEHVSARPIRGELVGGRVVLVQGRGFSRVSPGDGIAPVRPDVVENAPPSRPTGSRPQTERCVRRTARSSGCSLRP